MSFLGAAFKKSDLQVHSPRDRNWQGLHPEGRLDDSTPLEERTRVREAWAKKFVETCLDCELDAVAVTDHHEGVYLWSVIEAAEGTDLWVFPGMEVTVRDSAQALILFDAELPKTLFEKARHHLGLPSDVDPDSPQGIEVELVQCNIEDVQERLADDEELKDRFIILPNVTPGGHKTVLRKGFHVRFRDMPYVGGYLDKLTPDDLDEGDRRILEGEIPAWTSERRGVVTTSDCRHADGSGLGEHVTWIKLASPTAESLRQAMLAADSRLRYTQPSDPPVFIRSVLVSGCRLISADELVLSSQFNAVIGGRGAGKSTLLELLRFAMGRSALDEEDRDWDPTHVRRRELLDMAFTDGGSVQLKVNVDGADMTLERTSDDRDVLTLTVDGDGRTVTPADVRRLVPAQVFSQGALSHLAREEAESRLRDVITEPRRSDLEKIAETLTTQTGIMNHNLHQMVEFWTASENLRATESELHTTEARISALRESLPDEDEETRRVLEEHPKMIRLKRLKGELEEADEKILNRPLVTLDEAEQEARSLIREWQEVDLPEAAETVESLEATASVLADDREALAENLSPVWEAVVTSLNQIEELLSAHESEYEEAVKKMEGKEEKIAQLRSLEERLAELEQRHEQLRSRSEALSDSTDLFWAAWEERANGENRRESLLSEIAEELESRTGGLARAELRDEGDLSQLRRSLESIFEGTYVRESRQRDLLDSIEGSPSPREQWKKVFKELLDLLKWAIRGAPTDARPEIPILDGFIDEGGMERLGERLSPERVAGAVKAMYEPRLKVFQKRDEGEYEFQQASQGERATTLLTLLMSQQSGPLIIDQPEEDLDNRIIGDIVRATRSSKDQRQLVFATHNANLVVNGDAELVIELVKGTPENVGAIDHRAVRNAITDTMEGGREAFELRRKKYNF